MSAQRFGSGGVRSAPMDDKKRKAPRIGFLRPRHVERLFIVLLYGTLLVLVVLSVLGTYYGLAGLNAPLVEVHITNIHAREEFRHHSYVSGVADGVIAGLGVSGYILALGWLAQQGVK